MATNIVWHQHDVDKARRSQAKKQKACVLWLTGLSGSGKSTIANLLTRFYDVEEGTITIDDLNIKEVTLKSLRDQIAIVTSQFT